MDIGHDEAVGSAQPLSPAQLLVLANGGDVVDQSLGDRAAVRVGGGTQRFQVAARLKRRVSDGRDERLEPIVLCHEVSLRVHLDHRPDRALDRDANQTLGRRSARLLLSGGQAFGAQQINRRLKVAVRLGQRLLAIHHAGPGPLTQLLDRARGYLCHVVRPCSGSGVLERGLGRRLGLRAKV